jgi:hypothetical protein
VFKQPLLVATALIALATCAPTAANAQFAACNNPRTIACQKACAIVGAKAQLELWEILRKIDRTQQEAERRAAQGGFKIPGGAAAATG